VGVGLLEVDPGGKGCHGEVGTSDAGALDGCGETSAGDPGSRTVFAELTNDVGTVLVVDTDTPGTVGIEAHGSKVGVMGGSEPSVNITVIPAAFAPAVAPLEGRNRLAV